MPAMPSHTFRVPLHPGYREHPPNSPRGPFPAARAVSQAVVLTGNSNNAIVPNVSKRTATNPKGRTGKGVPPSAPFRDFLDEQLKDPEFRAEYDALEGEFDLIRQLIDLRIKRGLSQYKLAERAGMQQPTIARLEGGKTASLRTLRRVADALGADVKVSLVPRQAKPASKGSRRT